MNNIDMTPVAGQSSPAEVRRLISAPALTAPAEGTQEALWGPPPAQPQLEHTALPNGPYGAAVEDYANAGCLCLPANDKVPAIKWQNLKRRLPPDPKWDGFNIAMKTGRLSGVTVVDIDSTDPEVWLAMAERFGNPAIITSTPPSPESPLPAGFFTALMFSIPLMLFIPLSFL